MSWNHLLHLAASCWLQSSVDTWHQESRQDATESSTGLWLCSSRPVASIRDGTFHCIDCLYGAIICLTDTKSREVDTECGDPILVGSMGHWQKLSVIVSEGVRVSVGAPMKHVAFSFIKK